MRHALKPILAVLMLLCSCAAAQTATITINDDHVIEIDGRKVFPIGFTMPPPPDATTPEGKNGIQELRDAGGTFIRTGPSGGSTWDDEWISTERQYQDAAAKAGMRCLSWLKELSSVEEGDAAREAQLRKVIELFRDHPGMGVWKGADEPEWGMEPVPPLVRAYQIIKEMDPKHPVWIVEAPRGTRDSLRRYNDTRDITGVDIYPISYPPGIHSLLPNDEISLVGDHTRIMVEVVENKKPVWTTLQIAWSGVVKEERTLRMPTHFQQRFMAYHAIINGARGLIYFGGNLKQAMNARDGELGWNWTYWNNVLRPIIEELGEKSPLQQALVARESEMPIRAKLPDVPYAPVKGLEYVVREVEQEIYIIACRREGATIQVQFQNLPPVEEVGEVMFESPRKVTVVESAFTDWFAPFEVHVYKFKRKW